MPKSTYLRNKLLDAIYNGVSYSVTTPYVSLHTGDPGTTGASEVSGSSYARQAGSFGNASSGAVSTDAQVNFVDMPACTVTHVGIWDAISGGNFLWGGALSSSVVVGAGNIFRFNTGNLTASDS